jgi:hypothetical protein
MQGTATTAKILPITSKSFDTNTLSSFPSPGVEESKTSPFYNLTCNNNTNNRGDDGVSKFGGRLIWSVFGCANFIESSREQITEVDQGNFKARCMDFFVNS